jgi:cytochrome c oxidase assembly protein subunit 15
LPPLNEAQWEESFQLYQRYPEYKLKNIHMDISAFKSIFYFEYAHRLLGRLIGMLFFIPLVYFSLTKKLSRSLLPKLALMFLLGGLQGVLGWYMVKSGLVDNPHVSQYRLTAHLGLAVLIYGYILWVALGLLQPRDKLLSSGWWHGFSIFVPMCVVITMLSGGFVAGLKAGLAYNTFPLMVGKWVPPGLFLLDPTWRNFFENITTVQFDHRVLAIGLLVLTFLYCLLAWRAHQRLRTQVGLYLLLFALLFQVALGISTLLLRVPVGIAASHQGGALILLSASIFVAHQMRR